MTSSCGSALLTSAVGPADVSGVPSVSLTPETYRWGPRVRLTQEKEKGRAVGLLGSKGSWAGSAAHLGSARVPGLAQATAHRPARVWLPVLGRLGLLAY